MAESRNVVRFDGNAAGLAQAFQSLINLARADENALGETAKAARKVAREKAEMTRAAKRYYDSTRTPQERYNQKMRELGRLMMANKISQDTMTRAVRQANAELKEAEGAGFRAFGPQALSHLKAFAGALGLGGGIAGMIALVRSEYQALLEVQDRSKEATLTVADTQIKALRNLGADSKEEVDAYLKHVRTISTETGISERDIHLRMSTALSARGALPERFAMKAVAESARFVPEDQEAGIALAGAALDYAKITGIQDVEANLGLLVAAGKTARVTDIGKFGRQSSPALKALMAGGATPKEAVAIFSAITGGMVDPTGEQSKTAAIALVDRMKALKVPGGTITEQLRAIQADPRLQKGFADKGFEKAAKETMTELVTPGSKTAIAVDTFLKEIPSIRDAGAIYRRRRDLMRGVPTQRVAALERGLQAFGEQVQVENVPGAEASIIREHAQMLEDAGLSHLASRMTQLRLGIRGVTSDRGIAQQFLADVTAQRNRLLAPPGTPQVRTDVFGMPVGGFDIIGQPRQPTPVETRQAEVLGNLIQFMQQYIEESKRQTTVLERLEAGQRANTTAVKEAGRIPTLARPNHDPGVSNN